MKFNKKQKLITLVVGSLLIVAALLISVLENFGMISWHDVYKSVGIKEVTDVSNTCEMSVHFIDVGKADSIYVNCEDKDVLIDAGEQDTYNIVLEYLQKLGVKKLDLAIATHPHSDHIGGFPEILDELKVSKLLMPKIKDELVPTSRIYEKFLLAIERNKVPIKFPYAGETVNLGNLKIEVIAPNGFYDNINNHSIVAKLTYKNVSVLLTGDAEKESERDILNKNYNVKSNVLKVGHHGSRTSSTREFLKAVNPVYAVICVGEDKYNLPKKETINKLKDCGARIYRTDLDGTVVLKTDGEKIDFITSRQ